MNTGAVDTSPAPSASAVTPEQLAVAAGKRRELPRGNAAFRKVFERHSHPDDWGVQCVYDYAAWRIWKAAIRHERKRIAAMGAK
jgi:hypothetical protein